MKINVEVDCTPEEARRLVGLPDLTPVHDAYLSKMISTVENGVSPDAMMNMLKSWAPMGETGMKLWQDLLSKATGGVTKR